MNLINRPATLIQRLTSESTDRFGNKKRTEGTVEIVVEIQQKQRSETADEGETSDTTWNIYFPPGTDVNSGDAVVIDGSEYELTGDPWEARNPRTQALSHMEATVRRTAGPDDEAGS